MKLNKLLLVICLFVSGCSTAPILVDTDSAFHHTYKTWERWDGSRYVQIIDSNGKITKTIEVTTVILK